MSKKPVKPKEEFDSSTNGGNLKALDDKIAQYDAQFNELNWFSVATEFIKLAAVEEYESEEARKLSIIDSLDIYLEFKSDPKNKSISDIALSYLIGKEKALATVDRLTGAKNRSAFDDALQKIHGDTHTHTLVTLDLNNFKIINDELGHAAGDAALQYFTSLVNEILQRENDVLYRTGGDEFSLILPSTKLKQADSVVQKIKDALDQNPFVYNNQKTALGTSAGSAEIKTGQSLKTIIELADKRMYADKAQSKELKPSAPKASGGGNQPST